MRATAEIGSGVVGPERRGNGVAGRPKDAIVLFPGWLKAGFGLCIAIAVAVVIRRMVALSTGGGSGVPPEMGKLDAWFRAHAVLTWVHISVALVFVLSLPLVFWRRSQGPGMLQKAFFVLGAITGATAFGMSRYAVGGWLERSAVLVFDTLFLLSLARAYLLQRDGMLEEQTLWMTRAVAILLGIATTRPVMGVFFATQRVSHLTPDRFFGMAFWIGFSINTIVIELWLRSAARRVHG